MMAFDSNAASFSDLAKLAPTWTGILILKMELYKKGHNKIFHVSIVTEHSIWATTHANFPVQSVCPTLQRLSVLALTAWD